MQHVTDIWVAPPADGAGSWLLDSPCNDWAVRLRRFSEMEARETRDAGDTCFFVFRGRAEARLGGEAKGLACGATLFVPAGEQIGIVGAPEAYALEIVARRPEGGAPGSPRVLLMDEGRFEGTGFAYQTIADRAGGSSGLKLNMLKVAPGSGSPDFHIHAFDQIYFILEGRMHIDIGRRTYLAGADSLVYIPAGIVHRNYNAGPGLERHISLLVPEPRDGEVFDYAVTIHEHEAEIMTTAPVAAAERSA